MPIFHFFLLFLARFHLSLSELSVPFCVHFSVRRHAHIDFQLFRNSPVASLTETGERLEGLCAGVCLVVRSN